MRFSADGRPSFETHDELSCYDPLGQPIWVFDVSNHAMWWANRAALDLWGAGSVAELQGRDFSSDSAGVRERLQLVLRHASWQQPVEEGWTLYPGGRPVTVNTRLRPIRIEGGRDAVLIEATQNVDLTGDPAGLRILEAARISPLMISSFSASGTLLSQNPAAAACYGLNGDEAAGKAALAGRVGSDELAAQLLSALGGERVEIDAEVATASGPRWHHVIAAPGRDPLTAQPVLVLTEDDISERRAAQAELAAQHAETARRTSEEARISTSRLLAAIEAIPHAFALYDRDDRLVLFNQRYREVYPRHADLLQLGLRFEDMLRDGVARGEFLDAVGREEEWIAERMERHRNPEGPHEQKLADGRWLRVDERRTPDGETVGLRLDITELKTLAEQLRRSEERFRDFASAAADWLWETDAELRFTYISENIERILGAPYGWAYGKTREEMLGPDYDRRVWAEHLARLHARKPFRNFEYERVGEGLEPRWLRVSGVPIFDDDGNFTGYRGSGTDITEQKRAEEQLRQSEERFRDFASASADWLWEMDAELRFTYMTPNVERIVGVPAEWHYGKTREELLGPDYDRATWAEHLAALRAHKPFRDFDYLRVGDGVEPRWLRTSGIPIFDEAGNFAGYRGSGSDITAQKRAEEELRKRETELARAQKMEAVGQLTGGMAHDFNNLLAVIQGNAELLLELYSEQPVEIEAILRATQRGSELTQRLLAFSRQQTLRPRVISLGQMVDSMKNLLSRTLGETIEVATEADPDLWNAYADRGQVENVLLNLALNARDAMPRGGRLGIECANVRFGEPHLTEDGEVLAGDYVMLAVSDTGTGMSSEVKSHAFEPFFTTKEVGQGSGLGLSMVYGFAKQSKGHVAISSEVGAGTVVRLYLPRVQGSAERDEAEPEAKVSRGEGELVLLIEDNSDLRNLTRKMLEELGYQVIDVADSAAAERALIKVEGIDLVLADVVLPGGTSGAEFVEQARRTHPNIGYVLMSGHLAGIADQTAFTRKHKAFLRKPFRRAQLAETLRETLERVGAR